MFERRTEPLLPRRQFVARVLRGIALGLSLLAVALGGGMVGYRLTGMSWVDAYLNASMILAGMGLAKSAIMSKRPEAATLSMRASAMSWI